MFLIVGLGNPEARYQLTRHNVGFMAIDYIKSTYSFGNFQDRFFSKIVQGFIDNNKIFLVKPATYMNLSGQAIQSIVSYYKIQPQNLFVIHDDIDLEVGKVQLKFNGGNAGHNGVKSINTAFGHSNYYRIRIGVGKPINQEVSNYVLSNFSPEEHNKIMESIKLISNNINMLLLDKIEDFRNKVSIKSLDK